MMKALNTISESSLQWLNKNNLAYAYTKTTSSTQDIAKEEAFKLNTNLKLYITDYQAQGRGRIDNRVWTSKAQDNFLSTWSWNFPHTNITPILSEKIGKQVILSCKKTWPQLNWKLKLPNDIYLNNKKIAGLLIDILNQGNKNRLLIGFGFNIYSSPVNLNNISTHLSQETTLPINWEVFLETLFKNWQELLKTNL